MNDTPDTVESTAVELEPAGNHMLLGVQDPVKGLEAAERFANALKQKIEAGNLSSRISGNDYFGLGALQMAATPLGIVGVVTETQKLENGWEARAEARTLDGRVVGAGESQCTRDERQWARRDEFALRGMAQTRALVRALRGPVGSVLSLASYSITPVEEMPAEPAEPELPDWARPVTPVQLGRIDSALRQILTAVGVEDPEFRVADIEQRARERCGGEIPVCIGATLHELGLVVERAAKAASSATDEAEVPS